MAEQPLRAAQVAGVERGAHRRARHPLAFELDVGHRLDGEAVLFEGRKIALAAGAEAEIAPDDEPLDPEAAH
jgi:hypothetical protein